MCVRMFIVITRLLLTDKKILPFALLLFPCVFFSHVLIFGTLFCKARWRQATKSVKAACPYILQSAHATVWSFFLLQVHFFCFSFFTLPFQLSSPALQLAAQPNAACIPNVIRHLSMGINSGFTLRRTRTYIYVQIHTRWCLTCTAACEIHWFAL